MASNPGILTDWPWKPLGSFKYLILAPWVVHSIYSFLFKEESKRDLANFLILPFLLWRVLHNQIWISISRYRNAKGNNLLVDKSLQFEQVDREQNWDDQIIFNGIIYYLLNSTLPGASHFPIWRTDGVIITILLHVGLVEFLYYWFHRALHHHFLYSRYHSHHHSSIVTEPITSVIHPFAEHIVYFMLLSVTSLTTVLTGTSSLGTLFGYITYVDFMNNMGHCNFEFIPKWLFSIFPPLKYFMYTPTFHSLHHTQFRTNYSLFMPFYDYIYGTMDKSTDTLYETSLNKEEEVTHVVHLTHLTTLDSIYHLRLGLSSLASNPHTLKWYMWIMWPITLLSTMLTLIYGHTFVVERNRFNMLSLQTWVIPKYSDQYFLQWHKDSINHVIEQAILEAEKKGVEVFSLGLLNQASELNRYGELYVKRNPQLKIKVVDGSSLAAAIVLNNIPKGTTQVLIRGKITKVACAIAINLCKRGIQVATLHEDEHMKLNKSLDMNSESSLILSKSYGQKTWLVGDGLTEEEQLKVPERTLFIPYSQFPPKKLRKDCLYHSTPAMLIPTSLENVHSCENWLPRRVMSAWRIAGIVHALEGWNDHECDHTISSVEKVWQASLRHGFQTMMFPDESKY
ncbi:very-long-chain aldehyde decarbonylase CER1-like [Quercus suber]|uniref:very-long-chain aldehyde decarbonylase CER1-like n=1 Tax=Quercus suber TaxID=58331 RepID=UPI000CE24A78|nr:protein ECERIFERUM 1-like [Quercus suber]